MDLAVVVEAAVIQIGRADGQENVVDDGQLVVDIDVGQLDDRRRRALLVLAGKRALGIRAAGHEACRVTPLAHERLHLPGVGVGDARLVVDVHQLALD